MELYVRMSQLELHIHKGKQWYCTSCVTHQNPPRSRQDGFSKYTLYLSPDGSLVRPGWWVFPSLRPCYFVLNVLRGY